MRNYQNYYYDLILSTTPEDLAITRSTKIYYSFYNKNGKFSEAKFNGYLKAGLKIFNEILEHNKDKYTQEELQLVIQQKEQSEYILTLSSKEKEQIVQDTIEEVNQKNASLHCPNCGSTKFKTNASQNIFHCINCNNTYSKEELVKGNGYGQQEETT